jgi:hypothetical protein
MLLHPARTTVINGTCPQLLDAAALVERDDPAIEAIFCRRTGQSMDTVRKWLSGETYFEAAEAVQVGLADEVIPDAPLAALIPPSAITPPSTDERLFWAFAQGIGQLKVPDPQQFKAEAIAWLNENILGAKLPA